MITVQRDLLAKRVARGENFIQTKLGPLTRDLTDELEAHLANIPGLSREKAKIIAEEYTEPFNKIVKAVNEHFGLEVVVSSSIDRQIAVSYYWEKGWVNR